MATAKAKTQTFLARLPLFQEATPEDLDRIAAGTTVSSIDPSGRFVTLSAVTTAAVAGTVTATYNNATVFYNVAHINRPFAQGAIT